MEVSRVRALRGPNLWSRQTAVQAIVSCLPHEEDIHALPGFETRLRARFPMAGALLPTACGDSRISLAHALESVALHLHI